MTVLFGDPAGSPNSFHAALAHHEAQRLEAICIPWMPSAVSVAFLESLSSVRPMARRLRRRHFAPLNGARKVQGKIGEFRRLFTRAIGRGDEALSYQANDWLMRTMTRESRRQTVTAVHSYEDCSLRQFVEAKKLGKACIYDMPIGYYPAWAYTQTELAGRYADWLPAGGLPSSRYARLEQKRQEMELADIVMAPSSFVEETIRTFHPNKRIVRAPYGVDLDFWRPDRREPVGPFRFIYAGQLSIRKNTPGLIDAWEQAAVRDAELELVGAWHWADLLALRAFDARGIVTLFRGDSHLLDEPPGWARKKIKEAVLRRVFSWPTAFLVVGQANREYYRAFGTAEDRLYLCPHSIDVDRFAQPVELLEREAAQWRQQLKIPIDRCVILFAGKFEEKKRPLELMRAVQLLPDGRVTLVMLGGGRLEREVKSLAASDPDRFRVLPFQNQVRMPVVYRLGDLFVLPSAHGETWGLAVNEALSCGRPVLVSDRVGCAADVVDRSCGEVFSWKHSAALVETLEMMTRDRNRLLLMGNAAAKSAWAFDVSRTEAALVRCIADVCK